MVRRFHGLARQAHNQAHHQKQPANTLMRIAEEVGYQTDTAFSRAFRREFGAPPAAWRRSQEKKPMAHGA
ncbi:helix-turn-helix domain-containing protein [Pseudomonas sp. MDT1-16]